MTYSFNYDLRRDSFLQQRYLAYYNAQCCGFGVEYQTYNFSNYTGVTVSAGPPLQRVVHARRNRHVFELPRRVRRAEQRDEPSDVPMPER